ncbi:unnamed protein product [Sphenostylis stenocarpa]|uniref:Yip1 domain-containing protein n=1 Tax=Sphenostylis stenocarpa TaxID=92480 RepID=A0AA86T299_9FABA|nr:unnamed protein product [Sphenostylis stenocarpa]
MAEETIMIEPGRTKRKFVKKQGRKMSSKKTKVRPPPHGQKKVKIDQKMKKLFRKRAREYNSDDEEDEATVPAASETRILTSITNKRMKEVDVEGEDHSEDEGAAGPPKTLNKSATDMNDHSSDDEGEDDNEIQPGITKFTEGCRAFKMAFRNITKKSVPDDMLGPILSGHKKLVIDKLAEEEAERKVKGEAKKEKQMIAEKGHVKPAAYLDSHEKFLISVATKGVVKLFNAVNKAQTAHKGLNPSRTKDAKEIRKRTKQVFFSELGKPSLPAIGTTTKANEGTGKVEDEQPAWAPLRDNYMLTSSRIKDWDKMPLKRRDLSEGKEEDPVKMMTGKYTSIDAQQVQGSVPSVPDSRHVSVNFADSNLQTFPPSGSQGKITAASGPPRDADDSFSKPISGSDETQQGGWFRTFTLAAYKPYFDVDSSDVLERIIDSLFPFRGSFNEKTATNPDLYGPFWICTTLIFVAASIGTFVTYIAHKLKSKEWNYDINLVTWSAGLFYGYVTIVPLCLYVILKYLSAPAGLVQLFCLYGYSLFVFIPALCMSIVPLDIFRWVVAGVAGFMSATFVALNLRAHIKSAGERWFLIVAGIFLLQLALAVVLKIYLFTVTV